jgi:hypothetical protein
MEALVEGVFFLPEVGRFFLEVTHHFGIIHAEREDGTCYFLRFMLVSSLGVHEKC